MRTKIVILLIAVLTAFQTGKAQSVRSFESMGYDDLFIQGISGSISYFLKVKPDDDINNSKLILNFTASQVLYAPLSFLVISVKDVPVDSRRIESTSDTTFRVEIPLSEKYLQEDGRFIKLKITAKLAASADNCKDIDNPALWVSIKNSSYLSFFSKNVIGYQRSLKEWIQEFTSVYTPKQADLNDITCGAVVYAILKQRQGLEIYTSQYTVADSLPYGIIVGSIDKLPYSVRQVIPSIGKGQGLITLARVTTGLGLRTVLVVTGADETGFKKSINFLVNNRRISSAFSEKVLIDEAIPSYSSVENASPLVVTLESLGGVPAMMEGVGALRTKYNFSLSEFNAIPDKLVFHLESFFSTLKSIDRGFVNIYLNQNLVYNGSLSNRTNFIEDISLQTHMLRKFNSLEVEFRMHPGTNICIDGFANFFAFVNVKNSTLTFTGEKENRFYSFFNFPAEFRKVPTKILVSPSLLQTDLSSSLGELIYQINAPFNANYIRMILPPLVSSAKTSMDDVKGFNIIGLLNKQDPFIKNFSSLPVNYLKDFQLYKDVKGQVNYSYNDFSNSGMAQIFREKGSTFLMITALGSDSTNKNAFESVIKNFSTQLAEIQSNVCIANSSGRSNYFFKAPEDSDIVSYGGGDSKLSEIWEKYKWILLGVLLILVLLGFYFVRNKVKESQETFKDL
jgi:Bacterial cellulose synthase subunit